MNSYGSRAKKTPVKTKAATSGPSSPSSIQSNVQQGVPTLQEFLINRDYTGACISLEFQKSSLDLLTDNPNEFEINNKINLSILQWLGYSCFHLGDYKKSLLYYNELILLTVPKNQKSLKSSTVTNETGEIELTPYDNSIQNSTIYHLYSASCYFYLNDYKSCVSEANKCLLNTKLKNRLLFHSSHRLNDEESLMSYHQQMTDSIIDQLSLASIHYSRNHYQEATDIYKKLLIEYRTYIALQVYVSMCYYKLDYYDVSLEILTPYLLLNSDSAIASNLKACNQYKLYDGKAAEIEIQSMMDILASSNHSVNFENDLIKHNLVVFRNGDNAESVLPSLIDIIPEAKLNLVIYHLRHFQHQEAFELMQDLEPQTPSEYILKGVVYATIGQDKSDVELLKQSQVFFQLVGASASECDTIPGRQCMSSCFYLLKQFDDVLIYLNSIKSYCSTDSIFNYNFAISLTNTNSYIEAEEAFNNVTEINFRKEYCFNSWYTKCLLSLNNPLLAWENYLSLDSTNDSFALLVLIGNETYKLGQFYYSAKAFDVLERLDPTADYWEAKRGACCGCFQLIIAQKEKPNILREIIQMLKSSIQLNSSSSGPQAELIVRVMTKWAHDNRIPV